MPERFKFNYMRKADDVWSWAKKLIDDLNKYPISGVVAHGDLTGLGNDDHPQYLIVAEGDARYYTKAEIDVFNAAVSATLATKADKGLTTASGLTMATARFLGRITAGTGAIEELTATQLTAQLNSFTATLKGLVPLSGGGTTNFLRADGAWAAPSGGGGGNNPVFYEKEVTVIVPQANAGPTSEGASLTGTTSIRALADTNQFTRRRRFAVATAGTANTFQQLRETQPSTSLRRGFICRFRFGVEVINADGRIIVGLADTYSGVNDPVNATSAIFMGKDAADTNFNIFHNDAVGTCTKIALGASFPATTAVTDIYELTLTAALNATSVDYSVINIITAATVSGTISTDLPAVGLFILPRFLIATSTTAVACVLNGFGYYRETAQS